MGAELEKVSAMVVESTDDLIFVSGGEEFKSEQQLERRR